MQVVKDTAEINVPMEKFPRLTAIQKGIDLLEEVVVRLNKRKDLATSGFESLSEFDKNEREILVLRTDVELSKVHTSIIHKKNDIKDYLDKMYYPYCDEIVTNFDTVMLKAREKAKKDAVLADVLNKVDPEIFKENWEHKFNHYIAIKNYLDPRMASRNKPRKK